MVLHKYFTNTISMAIFYYCQFVIQPKFWLRSSGRWSLPGRRNWRVVDVRRWREHWKANQAAVGGGPSGRPDVQLLRKQERNIMWPEERSGLRRGEWWWKSSERMLPRVGSLHYLCGHCGHAGHSLLVRGGIKPRSSHNILEPTADLRSREKPSRPKSLHSSFEPINVPDGRRKKKRRRWDVEEIL